MAKFIRINRAHYDRESMIPLYRGDDWALSGKIVDITSGVENEVDLSDLQDAKVYFEAASGGLAPGLIQVVSMSHGEVLISVAKARTPDVAENPFGIGIYALLTIDGELETVPTKDQAIAVKDRSFPNS